MDKEYKLSNKKLKPHHLLSYRCPHCNGSMGAEISICKEYQIWTCEKCRKKFELTFRELIPNKKEEKNGKM